MSDTVTLYRNKVTNRQAIDFDLGMRFRTVSWCVTHNSPRSRNINWCQITFRDYVLGDGHDCKFVDKLVEA